MDILFIAKHGDANAVLAFEYLKIYFPESKAVFGKRYSEIPEDIFEWKGDYIFSYLSPWIIPDKILNNASKVAINWHPGPPEYPGIGCTNFAIYNNEKTFGITCHEMLPKVDTGKIIEVRNFDILENDTVFSITQKCYALIQYSFFHIVDKIYSKSELEYSGHTWQRIPYKRNELNELCRLTLDMDKKEIDRRIKATTYDKPWAYIEHNGRKFFIRD